MQSWPIYPALRFGTYDEFYKAAEKNINAYPIWNNERNPIFPGCYSTQARIKLANRVGERVLGEAEAFSGFANLLLGADYPSGSFTSAWTNLLFSQFHDILTGSGVIHTREYALGKFQETMAMANTQRATALRALAGQIDTSRFAPPSVKTSTVEGAGVGSGVAAFRVTQSDRGGGLPRLYHVFNPAPFAREEVLELTIWDWREADVPLLCFKTADGAVVPHQVVEAATNWYWYHTYVTALVQVKVPAGGWTTFILSESEDALTARAALSPHDQSIQAEDVYLLENQHIRVLLDPLDGTVVSFVDKNTGQELVDPRRNLGIFRLIHEDTDKGMTSWRVGRHMHIEEFTRSVRLRWVHAPGSPLRRAVSMECAFGRSKLKAVVSLDEGSKTLRYDVECDWHEIGTADTFIPQLNFCVPLAYPCASYKYDVPLGVLERAPLDLDQAANSFIYAVPKTEGTPGLMLWTDSKHGFRGVRDSMAVTLIRSAYDPDPYPEYGIHRFTLCITPLTAARNQTLANMAFALDHTMSALPDKAHSGSLPVEGSLIEITEGSVALCGIKLPENRDGSLIVRLCEVDGRNSRVRLKLFKSPRSLAFTDLLEEEEQEAAWCMEDGAVCFDIPSYAVRTLKILF